MKTIHALRIVLALAGLNGLGCNSAFRAGTTHSDARASGGSGAVVPMVGSGGVVSAGTGGVAGAAGTNTGGAAAVGGAATGGTFAAPDAGPDAQPLAGPDAPAVNTDGGNQAWGTCGADYLMCGCGCCADTTDSNTPLRCYYASAGETLATAQAADLELKNSTNCSLTGCARGVQYVCCADIPADPTGVASYSSEFTAWDYDSIYVTKQVQDQVFAQLQLVRNAKREPRQGFALELPTDWTLDFACNLKSAYSAIPMNVFGIHGTLQFRPIGRDCVLDLHATMFSTVTGTLGPSPTSGRLDVDGLVIKNAPASLCGAAVDGPEAGAPDAGPWDSGASDAAPLAFTQIATGNTYSCGLKSDGTVACWGCWSTALSAPLAEISLPNWYNGCGVQTDGTLACWTIGNSSGCNGTEGTPPGGTFKHVSVGTCFACGLGDDNTVACWGYNYNGQAASPSGTFVQVSAGDRHACGIKKDGTVLCWGSNTYGESTPPSGTFTQVSAGSNFTCGLRTDGTLACWGDNTQGQSAPASGAFTQVSAGADHACGVRTNGTVACWGTGGSSAPAGAFSQVSATGMDRTCGLKSDGTVTCWGCGSYAGCGMCNAPLP